jgi:hypothetical protein
MRITLIIIIVLTGLTASVMSAWPVAPPPYEEPPPIDLSKPESWIPAAKQLIDERDAISERLKRIIDEPNRFATNYLDASELLGQIGTPFCWNALVDHIDLELRDFPGADDAPSKRYPCYRSLVYSADGRPRRNWDVARAIFLALDRPQSERRLRFMAVTLEKSLTREREGDRSDRALALVDFELGRKPAGHRLTNLQALRQRLQLLKNQAPGPSKR